jgi:hypothetical protein
MPVVPLPALRNHFPLVDLASADLDPWVLVVPIFTGNSKETRWPVENLVHFQMQDQDSEGQPQELPDLRVLLQQRTIVLSLIKRNTFAARI